MRDHGLGIATETKTVLFIEIQNTEKFANYTDFLVLGFQPLKMWLKLGKKVFAHLN